MIGSGFAEFKQHAPGDVVHLDLDVLVAGPEDLHAILAIERASERPVGAEAAMAASLATPTRHTVIAVSGGETIGWAKTHYWSYADAPAPAGHYLGGITVHPDWRRHGVGAALTAARMEWIWARATDAWYVVNVRNRASIELHRRWGFEEIARAPAFHTTRFTGGIGLLMRAQRATPQDLR